MKIENSYINNNNSFKTKKVKQAFNFMNQKNKFNQYNLFKVLLLLKIQLNYIKKRKNNKSLN